MSDIVYVDGSEGEGGGQILRTSLTLAAITGKAICVDAIRAKRRKPGLLRQHLAAVRAAAALSGAEVVGAELGSSRLTFRPREIRGGAHRFAIASAGSACLVAETVLPVLLHAREPSEIVFEGGTHNDQAPTFDFLSKAYLPLLRRMGASVDASLERYGFYPAGGGVFRLRVAPSRLAPLELIEPGTPSAIRAEALFAQIPHHVAARELAVVRRAFDLPEANATAREVKSQGPGNVLSITLERDPVEVVTSFGRRGVRAEAVAAAAVTEAKALVESGAPVGPHLADQLLLPIALAGGGALRTVTPTSHTRTNARVIERFLGVPVTFEEAHPGAMDIVVGRPLG